MRVCSSKLRTDDEDVVQVIRNRLQVYHREAAPVEEFFRQHGALMDFEITAGIPETLPGLLTSLKPHIGNWEIADVDPFP
jgi:adenylate kinase